MGCSPSTGIGVQLRRNTQLVYIILVTLTFVLTTVSVVDSYFEKVIDKNETNKKDPVTRLFDHLRNSGLAFGIEVLGYSVFSVGWKSFENNQSFLSYFYFFGGLLFIIIGILLIWLNVHFLLHVLKGQKVLPKVIKVIYVAMAILALIFQYGKVTNAEIFNQIVDHNQSSISNSIESK